MKQSTLDSIERIVDYMFETGIREKVDQLTSLGRERVSYSEAISKAFSDLLVIGFDITEAKYVGYGELVDNKDKPERLDSIMKKHTDIVQEKLNRRKEIELRISELLFLLEDLRDRAIAFGDIVQNEGSVENKETVPAKESA